MTRRSQQKFAVSILQLRFEISALLCSDQTKR